MRELKIGMLQLHNTADTEKNIENLIEGIKDLAKRGAELVVLHSCTTRSTSVKWKT